MILSHRVPSKAPHWGREYVRHPDERSFGPFQGRRRDT